MSDASIHARNPGVKTIESEVFDACVKAGAISEDNSDNVNKVSHCSGNLHVCEG